MKNILTLNLCPNNLNSSQVGQCPCGCFVHDSPPLLAALPSQLQLPLHRHIYKSLSCQLRAGTYSKSILAPSPVTILSRGAVPRLAHVLQVPRPVPRCHGSVQAQLLGEGPCWENIRIQNPTYANAYLHKRDSNKQVFMWTCMQPMLPLQSNAERL